MYTRDDRQYDQLYLPDLCNVRRVFAVVIAAELLAYVLTLSQSPSPEGRWQRWMMASLFIQWVALSSTALLCLARRLMRHWSRLATTLYSFGLVLAVTVLVSEGAYWIGRHAHLFPRGDWHGQFLIRNLTISAIVTVVVLRYFYVQHQLERNIQAEAHARIQALQARVRPHFLFNSMNTIASLTR
ncbi:MAG TPA: histidine kinase, partial [Gammaproteobacteria bacterium]|nr:histidine kinase [Gammaproteobacteria bacterium]